MSLFEQRRSDGSVSLARLLAGEQLEGVDTDTDLAAMARTLSIGGWPGLQSLEQEAALRTLRGYVDEVSRADVSRVDDKRRDPVKVQSLLASLARNTATHVKATTLAADAGGSDGPLDEGTVREYLDVLERLMVIESQPAWSPHLRSRRQLRQAPKRHFVDPSLAVAALRGTPERLIDDLRWFGCLFESLVVRDLRVYAQAVDARVFQYRDSKGLEVDAIVEGLDGRWAAFEVKLDASRVDEAAESLLRFARNVDSERCPEPSALAVIVRGGLGFTLENGVQIVPINALGP